MIFDTTRVLKCKKYKSLVFDKFIMDKIKDASGLRPSHQIQYFSSAKYVKLILLIILLLPSIVSQLNEVPLTWRRRDSTFDL